MPPRAIARSVTSAMSRGSAVPVRACSRMRNRSSLGRGNLGAVPNPGNLVEDVGETGTPPSRRCRIVRAAVKRLEIWRKPHTHRPPARTGRRLHECHVDAIDIWPLLTIDLDRHVVPIQSSRHIWILEALMFHLVAP